MVSKRCKILVKEELKKLGLHFIIVELGVVEVMENITPDMRKQISVSLLKSGLELMDDRKAILIEKVENAIIEAIHYSDKLPQTGFSDYLSSKTGCSYAYLSELFTELKGITIDTFINAHKIERVKELLIYDELSLSEIAWNLRYISVVHLSGQFKKIRGLSPSHFKNLKFKKTLQIGETDNREMIGEL
jgi:AraC-like DNA-binding protein